MYLSLPLITATVHMRRDFVGFGEFYKQKQQEKNSKLCIFQREQSCTVNMLVYLGNQMSLFGV
eukprot:TRINITY_DN5577_c0_g1_i1.p1 TRINITY_DN5577_c0_g1~~TRINITY_DN5577_c0_g1_i1.p1  ORF type:complete len:63 (-),score=7.26 TRINITY_DN5577_c0_g1_i1:382-570(-)